MQDLNLSVHSEKIRQMFDSISGRYDLLNTVLSAGQDVFWRKELVKRLPFQANKQGKVVDVACGTGDILIEIAKHRYDYLELFGYDISEKMIQQGEKRAKFKGVLAKRLHRKAQGATFALNLFLGNAEAIPLPANYCQAVTIAFGLRNVEDRAKALQEFYRILQPGGKVLILEFFKPEGKSVFTSVFDLYFKNVLPKIGALFSNKNAYAYLPNSVNSMPTHAEFTRHLKAAGFTNIDNVMWLGGAVRLYEGTKAVN